MPICNSRYELPDCDRLAGGLRRVPHFVKGGLVSTSLNTPFDWDVFLSQSSADKSRVARLAERLKAAGFRVCFDHPTIDSGEDILTAIEQSRVLVLCMTKAAFESEWVRLRRNTATFRDPGNHDRRILPLRMDDCQIPATLRRLKYINWQAEYLVEHIAL